MVVKIYNFYTKEKLSINRYHNILMNMVTFYIMLNIDGYVKEYSIQIPKRYHYESTYFNHVDFPVNKIAEYNILFDYIKNNDEALKDKWGLSDEEYYELRDGLKLALIREYSTCSVPRKVFLETTVLFKIFVGRILRRIVE